MRACGTIGRTWTYLQKRNMGQRQLEGREWAHTVDVFLCALATEANIF